VSVVDVPEAVTRAHHEEWARVVASLTRRFGDLDIAEEAAAEAFAIALDDCDSAFLSVDVDVVDPGMAPGTGTPEPGGLTGRQLLDAVRRIAMEVPLAGIDVVEVSPPYDHAEVTGFLANRVVLEALSGIAWRRKNAASADGGGHAPDAPLLSHRGPESD